jgi:hypothetical protein
MSTPSGSDRPFANRWPDGATPTVVVQRTQHLAYLPPRQARHEPDRHQALIVTTLTLACTVLSIYDLFLLASGAR